jgi:hypothetical protein
MLLLHSDEHDALRASASAGCRVVAASFIGEKGRIQRAAFLFSCIFAKSIYNASLMKRFYYEYRQEEGCICVIDRHTNATRVKCHQGGIAEAKAHARGLNR